MNTPDTLSQALETLSRRLASWRGTVRTRRAVPEPDVAELRERLSAYTFTEPKALDAVVEDVAELMERWTVHTTHPGYYGLFNANVHDASVAADALAAGYNPQVGLWSHSPGANEIERHVLRRLTRAFGFDPETSAAHFTTGGSEANFSAMAAALTRAFPPAGEGGLRALDGPPVLYVSRDGHHSVEKSAQLLGLGRTAVRWVDTDDHDRLDPGALAACIRADRDAGALPFLVIGTAGTTSLGAVDSLADLAAVCRQESLWFHVDAAWGGGAILSPQLRGPLRGIELADSITCDAHKWLSVSMGAGMLFCRHPGVLRDTFGINAPYVTGSILRGDEPFNTTLQWSRRFIGLKLFMTLAHLGEQGMIEAIEHQAAMGSRLREILIEAGWTVVNHSPFPLVCFTRPEIENGSLGHGDVVDRLYDRGKVWISQSSTPAGRPVLRACICNYETRESDLDVLRDELAAAVRG